MEGQDMEEAKKIVTETALKMVKEILTSKTKYAVELSRLLKFYTTNLDKAPPATENCSFTKEVQRVAIILKEQRAEREKESLTQMIEQLEKKPQTDMQEIKKATRNLYEERTGKKWRPSLRVIQGGGNTSPITRKVTRHKKPDH